MKKYGLRVLVGLIAFAIGLFSVWMLISEVKFRNYCNQKLTLSETEISKAKNPNGKIEVYFKQIIQIENGKAFEFVVENNTNETISYSSYQLKDENLTVFPLHEVKVGGKKIDSMWCGTGLMSYQIKSGEFKIFQVNVSSLVYSWKKGKTLQVGFNFKKASEKEYQIIWSGNLANSNETVDFLVKGKVDLRN